MKTIVSVQEIDEFEIKPEAEVEEWRRLVSKEIDARWSDRSGWLTVGCPCCHAGNARSAFAHAGIAYVECTSCGTLYAPQRPGEASLREWYRTSAPARFWRERLLAASGTARFEKIVRPRAQWVLDGIAEYVSVNGRAVANELALSAPQLELIVTGATADLEGASSGRVTARATPVAGLTSLGPVDLVTALDAFDRAVDLPALVNAIYGALAMGGVLFATVPVASGFEVQSLWDRSPTVLPPDKLNLPTVEGLLRMFGGSDWELLELSTPGMFDVEIVRRAVAAAPAADWPRAVRALVSGIDANSQQAFTEYLQSRRLASFARLVARRRA
jgi:ribosomal protein S27E